MSASSYLLSRSPKILILYPAAVPTWMVFTGTSSGCMQGAEAEPRWRKPNGARSWPPSSSAAS
jgi:hypothetical protein